ncbi:hypothetical protein [Chamaesiphon polymorphus]|uniref:Uncharacterized protein n=1 Tax=Chamaesiphon polymorphus CCALA 037 TaxID=2107692 RepID=A0A2T1GK79_9CYAN|nr:hypothetical protein [Chamaesiphon polymorphus]PSB58228.1 hypothetical protein C7B77_05555 [Chamaesiphon polymorphus CCALA 037]
MSNVSMRNILWTLGRKKYKTYDDFIVAVTDYNNYICREPGLTNSWNPDEEISQQSILVVYEAGWKDEDATISLEIGEDDRALTMGRFLFSLNNTTYDFFKDADCCFFEGLELVNGNKYELWTGS